MSIIALLIKNTMIYTDASQTKQGMSVLVEGNVIKSITDDDDVISAFINEHKAEQDFSQINGSGYLLMPGLVNTHTHSPMTVLRNIGSDLTLQQWLFGEIIPRECNLTPENVYYGSMAAQMEMMRSGTTCFCDMYEPFEMLTKATLDSGMRANICTAGLHNDWSTGEKRTYETFEQSAKLFKQYSSYDRLNIFFEMHSVYLYRQEWLSGIVENAKKFNTGIHMHLHETEKEISDFMELNNGIRPTEFLESIGAFDVKTVAAHCTHMNDSDIQILKKHDVNVAVNMTSNLKLGSGIPPLPKFLEAGINVTLGTDGCASNNNLNMFEEMHLAALLYKGLYKDPTLIKAQDVVNMATVSGAKALLSEPCGAIKEGYLADMILVDLSGIHLNPINDINALICYCMQGSDVDTVIINGNVIMKNKKFLSIDEEKIMSEVNSIILCK